MPLMKRALIALIAAALFAQTGYAQDLAEVYVVDTEATALYKVLASNLHVRVPLDENISSSNGVVRDPVTGDIYYTDSSSPTGAIIRANPDGTNPTTVIGSLNSPTALAFSEATNELFWIELTMNSEPAIYKIGKGGTPGPTFLTMGVPPVDGPIALAVDAAGQFVYWTDSRGASIRRMPTTGGAETNIVENITGTITGITVDSVNQRVYWLDQLDTNIYFADLTQTFPTTQQVAVDDSRVGQGGLDIDTSVTPPILYFTNISSDQICRAPVGGSVEVLLSSADDPAIDGPSDLAILVPTPTATPTATATVTPEATGTPESETLTPGTIIDEPPVATVTGRSVTLVFQEFTSAVRNSPALAAALETLKKAAPAGALQIRYDVRVTAPKRRDNRSVLAKRNELTLKNLAPGNYSVNYKVNAYQKRTRAQIQKQLDNGKSGFAAKFKKVFSTNRSPAAPFTISR